jgi:hypothetical protein
MIKTIILSSILTAALGTTAAFAQEPTQTIRAFNETFVVPNYQQQPQIDALATPSPMQSKIVHVHFHKHARAAGEM